MDLAQVIVVMSIVVSNVGCVLFLHFKSDDKLEQFRSGMEASRKENSEILRGIAQEMKDFHGRLISLEERSKK